MAITIPLGWKVPMNVTNKDSLPHSLEIAPAQTMPPIDSVATVFPRAETIDLKMGMAPNTSDSLSFTADKCRFHLIDHTHARAKGAAGGGASYGVVCNSTPLQQLR